MTDLAGTLKAFGELTRLRILRLISAQELAVNELVDALQFPQSRVSRHLSVLRNAGLTRDRREGNWIYYRLVEAELPPFARAVWQAVGGQMKAEEFFPEDLRRLEEILDSRAARSRSYFDVVSAEWDRIRRHYIDDTLSFLTVSSLIQPEAVVVDVGAGTGEVLLSLAKMARRVVGVDQSAKMLSVCRRRVEEAGLDNVELIHAEAERLPLDDACCDVAFSSMLLHHLSDPAAGVGEMARIVKPGGKVVITDLVRHDCDWTREVMADVWLGFAEDQIRAWLAAAGLGSVAYWPTRMPASADPQNVGKLQAFIATGVKPGSSREPGAGSREPVPGSQQAVNSKQ